MHLNHIELCAVLFESIVMNHQLEVNKTIDIAVSPMLVWRALTDKETIKKYFFGTEAISDWQVGSSLIFRGEWEGKTYEDKGNIHVAVPGKLLVYDYWSGFSGLEDNLENYSLVSYTLDKSDEGTIVSLTQKGFSGEEAQAHAEGGWTMVLHNLKELLEGK
jgi:uncharacterized protein YndB with AHSA1/START domain